MSSRAVRVAARQWATALATPYYDTINTEQNPPRNVPVWFTIEFDSFGMTKETYCDTWAENGDIVLTFFGQPGIGDDALLVAAEADAATFYASVDPAGRVLLVDRSAPEDFVVTEKGPRYAVSFRFGYEFR